MVNHQPPDDIIAHNQNELEDLAWSIEKAQDLAQQALDCLAVSSEETDKPWQMAYAESQYRFTLAQAYSGLNQPQAAIENLERAQIVGSPEQKELGQLLAERWQTMGWKHYPMV